MLRLPNQKFIFFWNLPISFNCLDKKLFLSDRVYVDSNAQDIITQIEEYDKAIAYSVYPQFGVSGLGCQHRIMCADIDENNTNKIRQEMWELLGILRLIKPLPLHIAGTIDILNQKIYTFETNWHHTHLHFQKNLQEQENEYNLTDLSLISELHKVFYEKQNDPNTRLRLATDSFIRASFTEPIMFADTFFQKLFPIIDLLSGNPSWKHYLHVKLNLGKWLHWVYKSEAELAGIDLEQVVESLWENYRSHYLHLSCSVAPPSHLYMKDDNEGFRCKSLNIQASNGDALIALHEVVRLCLLSILYLPNEHQLAFNLLPRVEMRLPTNERKDEEKRMIATQNYYKNLIDQNIRPSNSFWLPQVHCQIFTTLSK